MSWLLALALLMAEPDPASWDVGDDPRGDAAQIEDIERGEFRKLLAEARERAAQAETAGDRSVESQALNQAAVALRRLGQAADAIAHHERALRILGADPEPNIRAQIQADLGVVLKQQGQYERALELQLAALETRIASDDPRALSESYRNVGVLYGLLGRAELARSYLERALSEADRAADPRESSLTRSLLARRCLANNDLSCADRHAREALKIGLTHNLRSSLPSSYLAVGTLELKLGNEVKALEQFATAHQLALQIAQPMSAGRALMGLGDVELARGNPAQAQAHAAEAERTFAQIGSLSSRAEALALAERAAVALTDYQAAHRYSATRLNVLRELFDAQASERVAQFSGRIEAVERDQELAQLRSATERQELQARASAANARMTMALLVCSLIILGLMVWRVFESQRSTQRLRALHDAVEAQRDDLMRMNKALAEQSEQLRIAATTDALTGAANRGHVYELLSKLLGHAAERRHPLTVILIDLDHFKQVNDRYGHAVGDAALRISCLALRQLLGEDDVLGRLGGEEFVLIAPGRDVSAAQLLAEACRHTLAQSLAVIGEHPINGSASFGVAVADPSTSHTIDSLLRCADEALYKAKHKGRNRVELAAVS